jgi:pyruvate/2-oxoglutarate dehydrogenase complex dihydrolipoamide dehydrogenase (E3) component
LSELDNITLFLGEAIFIDKKKIEVNLDAGGKTLITAKTIFINTGAHTSIPDIKGLHDSTYYTSATIMDLEEVPEHLIILGGGYIGLEFGQMYKRFGSKVTIIEPSDRILKKEDNDITDAITKFLKEEGIELITQGHATSITGKQAKEVTVTLNTPAGEKALTGSHLLIAAGRTPNTKALQTNLTGVNLDDHGHVVVNEKLETSCPGIYALGDVKGGPQFTHIAYNDYVIVSKNLLHEGNESTHNRVVPYCMFTDPQLGRVGITEAEARKKNMNIKVATLPMKYVARAIESRNTTGMMKVIIDVETSQLIGAAVLGEIGGEIMTILQVAMIGKITYHQLRYMVFAHPLYAEAINNLFMQFDDK